MCRNTDIDAQILPFKSLILNLYQCRLILKMAFLIKVDMNRINSIIILKNQPSQMSVNFLS